MNDDFTVKSIEKADYSYPEEYIFTIHLSNGIELEVSGFGKDFDVEFNLCHCPEHLDYATPKQVALALESMGYQWTWEYLTSKFKEFSSNVSH